MDESQFAELVEHLHEIKQAVHAAGLLLSFGLGWVAGALFFRRD